MLRPVLAAALLLGAPAALAQAVTQPVVTASAGVLRSSSSYDEAGNTDDDAVDARSFSASLGGEVPVWSRGAQTVSAGAALTLASFSLILDGSDQELLEGRLRPQRLDVFGRIGNAWASALLGASLNLGSDPYDGAQTIGLDTPPGEVPSYSFNSDGQHALIAQVRGVYPLGRIRITGQADAAVVFTDRVAVPSFYPNNGEPAGTLYDLDVDNGNPLSVRLGAEAPVGPVVLGLAGFYATRSEGSTRYVDGLPPGFPADYPTVQSNQLGYREALGLIPSVAFRTSDGRVTVRAEGAFSDFFAMENAPVGLTLSGKLGPVTRPALTISAAVGL